MLDIQIAGSEILGGNPRNFYAFVGPEYGIKHKYIDILAKHYGKYKCVPSVSEVLKFLNSRHLIPVEPQLYVVRYDDAFIKSLDDSTFDTIKNTNIVGTIVCIYEDSKSTNKLEKYLPDYTVDISGIESRFMIKYIHMDFPNLPDRLAELSVNMDFPNLPDRLAELSVKFSHDYYQAQNIARCMSHCNISDLFKLSDTELSYIFGVDTVKTDDAVKRSIASRNFKSICSLIDCYPSLDQLMYVILSTLVELEKIHYNKYATSDIQEYSDLWSLEDIYNMFMQTYKKLQDSRSISTDIEGNIIYLAALTQFKTIPSLEAIA